MEIGKQIQKYRTELDYSQDELAEKIYVTRQTVSNWENQHTYPDLRSLLLLSEAFGISLDQLVKGDLEEMKQEISREDVEKMHKSSIGVTVFLLLLLILPIPLAKWLGWAGLAVYFPPKISYSVCLVSGYGRTVICPRRRAYHSRP